MRMHVCVKVHAHARVCVEVHARVCVEVHARVCESACALQVVKREYLRLHIPTEDESNLLKSSKAIFTSLPNVLLNVVS